MTARTIYWIDLNRFDTKPDKSTWLEMGHELNRLGFQTYIVTSFKDSPYQPTVHDVGVVSIRALDFLSLFRISLLLKSVLYLIRRCDRNSIIIIPVGALLAVPILRLFQFHNIHLDVRTVPVTVHGSKRHLDKLIYWDLPLRFFARSTLTYSFITERLKVEVEKVTQRTFTDACIWSSGVKASMFVGKREKSKHLPGASYNIFYHGTVTKDRGIFDVVAAIEMLQERAIKDITLTIVGSGPDIPALAAWIRDKPFAESISVVGLVPYECVPELIDLADCCISPLPPRPEWQVSSPLKVFEYMAMAKPIIATRIFPHLDVLERQEFVVWTDGHDARSVADAIEYAKDHREQLAAAAQVGPALVKNHYDWSGIAKTFAHYLDNHYGTEQQCS